MKFGDIKERGESSYKAGVNDMHIVDWAIMDGTYGKQLQMEFSPNRDAEKPRIFKCWVPFQREFKTENSYVFSSKINQYNALLENFLGAENATAFMQKMKEALGNVEFDNEDKEQVQNLEEKIVTAIFKQIAGNMKNQTIPVVLGYKDQYLNVPSYKDNEYKLPFGPNPHVGKGVILVKPEATEYPSELPPPPVNTDPFATLSGNTTGLDDLSELPF